MRTMLFFICLSWSTLLFGQVDSLELKQINKDVWYNFMQAYQDLDASLFNQIHTDDVMRVVLDQQQVWVGREYLDRNLEVFNRWNANRLNQQIEFSFLSRLQKEDWAYEVGIYKIRRFGKFGQETNHYGKFYVTLRKVNGTWKIQTDADSSENGNITALDFVSGNQLSY